MMWLQVLARNARAATTIVQEGALPALAAAAGEGLSDRARLNASKVHTPALELLSCAGTCISVHGPSTVTNCCYMLLNAHPLLHCGGACFVRNLSGMLGSNL